MPAPASSFHAAAKTAGSRVAYLVANSPHAAAIVNAMVANIVGDGPAYRSRAKTVALVDAFLSRFWSEIDVEGFDAGHFLARLVRCWIVQGEAFVVLFTDPETGAARARLINPDQVDRAINQELPDGGRIVQGVELDRYGRRRAYHIRPDAPDLSWVQQASAERVAAEDVLHLYDPQTPGQIRGISMLAAIAARLVEIDKLEDAQLASANTTALFGLVFKTPGGEFGSLADAPDPQFPTMEPGASIVAPPGFDVESFQPPRMDGATEFLKAMQRSAAAGVSVPYALMTGDLSDTNYSSARLGLLEFRRRVVAIQKNLLVPLILDPLWTRWATLEQLAGRLPAGDVSGEWVFPGWQALDPEKEARADAEAIRAGIRSRFEVVAARGRDPQEVDAEIAADTFTPREGGANA
ncbi:MAG: phage portal protein [Devosia sp.]